MNRGSQLVKVGVLMLMALMIVGGLGIGSYLYIRSQQIDETQKFQRQLRNGLVTSCERNGNPLREAVQKMLRDEVAQSKAPILRRLFPQIPPVQLERLIRAEAKANEATIREIAPVDCASLYPRP